MKSIYNYIQIYNFKKTVIKKVNSNYNQIENYYYKYLNFLNEIILLFYY